MWQMLTGSLALSLVHAAVPNHWLPLVAIGRAEGWSRSRALRVTAAVGAAHTASTILIGVLIGAMGLAFAEGRESLLRLGAAAILLGLGVAYLVADWRGARHHHHHHDVDVPGGSGRGRSDRGIMLSLAVAMFFSPCLELEAYYLTAATEGWWAIAAVSAVYFAVTVMGMMALVALGWASAQRLHWHLLEHHERAVTGGLLVVLGAVAWFLE